MKSPEEFIHTVVGDWELFCQLYTHFEQHYKGIDNEEKRDRVTILSLVFWLGRVYGQEEVANGKQPILEESSRELQK